VFRCKTLFRAEGKLGTEKANVKRDNYVSRLPYSQNGCGKQAPSHALRIENPNVAEIRRHLGLTQQQFTELLGISPATLRNREQGRRKPEGAARVLLCVAAKYPKEVLDTVNA
jgi:putative transcriptional regulator